MIVDIKYKILKILKKNIIVYTLWIINSVYTNNTYYQRIRFILVQFYTINNFILNIMNNYSI